MNLRMGELNCGIEDCIQIWNCEEWGEYIFKSDFPILKNMFHQKVILVL